MSATIEKIREYYNRQSDKSLQKNIRHDVILATLDKYIPRYTTVLDIGCGSGITSKHLAEGDRLVEAIDLSSARIEYASANNAHPGVLYTTGDITSYKPVGKFDAIVMADVFEHIQPDRISALFDVILKCSHESTLIYLNVPDYDYLSYVNASRPDLAQIVDVPYKHEKIIELFENISFVASYYQKYWMQYVEYVFMPRHKYNRWIKEYLKKE